MVSLVYKLVYLLLFTINISIIVYTINIKKLNKKAIILFSLYNYIIFVFINLIKIESLTLINIVVSTTIFTYIIFKNIFYSVITSGLTVIIIALSDLVSGTIISLLLKINSFQIARNPKIYFVTLIFISINSFILSKFTKKIMKKPSDINLYLSKYKKYLSLITLFVILVLVFIFMFLNIYRKYSIMQNNIIELYGFFIMCSFVFIIILFLVICNNIKVKLQNEFKDKEYTRLKEYTSMLEVLTNDFRKFKHDYINLLKTFGGLIELQDMEQLNIYYKELVTESEIFTNEDNSFIFMKNLNISTLKSLIASKIFYARSLHLTFKLEIADEINELSIKTIDICRIIGIFIDNAIEAAVETEDKIIELAIAKNDNNTMFKISNSCSKDTPPIFKMYKKNYSTKGVNRGLGLKIVKEIINERYSNNVILNTRIRNNVFSQELIINN